MGKLGVVLWLDVLNSLPVILEHIDSDNGVIPLSVGRLQDIIVCVFAIVKCIQALEKELKHSAQVFWAWSRHENIAETIYNGTSKSDT